jgi:hypothetical protein
MDRYITNFIREKETHNDHYKYFANENLIKSQCIQLEFRSEVTGWKWSKEVTSLLFKMNEELTFYWQVQRSIIIW